MSPARASDASDRMAIEAAVFSRAAEGRAVGRVERFGRRVEGERQHRRGDARAHERRGRQQVVVAAPLGGSQALERVVPGSGHGVSLKASRRASREGPPAK